MKLLLGDIFKDAHINLFLLSFSKLLHVRQFFLCLADTSTCIILISLPDPSATPIHWQLATLVLGILCMMLLIARGALGYNGKFIEEESLGI